MGIYGLDRSLGTWAVGKAVGVGKAEALVRLACSGVGTVDVGGLSWEQVCRLPGYEGRPLALPKALCWTEGKDVKCLRPIAGSLERRVQWLARFLD